jgi:hypothetical protein
MTDDIVKEFERYMGGDRYRAHVGGPVLCAGPEDAECSTPAVGLALVTGDGRTMAAAPYCEAHGAAVGVMMEKACAVAYDGPPSLLAFMLHMELRSTVSNVAEWARRITAQTDGADHV